MAETKSTPKHNEDEGGTAAPASVGRSQQGEKTDSTPTSRVPRGVGEPASDALAEHEGLKATQEAVKKTVDADNERGFRGVSTSPVPNENYTVAGVTKGLPTPETVVYTPRSK